MMIITTFSGHRDFLPYATARPVRLSSVTSVIRTQAIELFADIFCTVYIAWGIGKFVLKFSRKKSMGF